MAVDFKKKHKVRIKLWKPLQILSHFQIKPNRNTCTFVQRACIGRVFIALFVMVKLATT